MDLETLSPAAGNGEAGGRPSEWLDVPDDSASPSDLSDIAGLRPIAATSGPLVDRYAALAIHQVLFDGNPSKAERMLRIFPAFKGGWHAP